MEAEDNRFKQEIWQELSVLIKCATDVISMLDKEIPRLPVDYRLRALKDFQEATRIVTNAVDIWMKVPEIGK